jgi:hypothetical protein
LVALLLGEVLLRLVPIPGVTYHSFYYDAMTGGKYVPHTTLLYQNKRGDKQQRRANSWGFPDHGHAYRSEPGTLRIGFFGDSYTEARQVSLENTYFRIVENDLNARADQFDSAVNLRGEPVRQVETISFGISGRSALQSYLEYRQWMTACSLD